MNGSTGRQGGALFAIAATLLLAAASEAVAQTVPSDLRVVASDGRELADVRQYVGKTVVPTSPDADCFGPGNRGSGNKVTQVGADALSVVVEASAAEDRLRPLLLTDAFLDDGFGPGNRGSGNKVTQVGADALSVVVEASAAKDQLGPLLLTDAFLDDGFGLGVCAIGGLVPPPSGFWYLKINHKNPNLGGSLVTVGPGTETLWYLTPTFPPGAELVLNAPARTTSGVPVRVEVLAYSDDGTPSPAAGAVVEGGSAPATVDASGGATVSFPQPGVPVLRASRGSDIPSQALGVCVADPVTQCPELRGREILGTDGPDNIVGTLGADQVRPRAGNDNIKSRAGGDLIVSRGGGADKVKCGGGKDVVEADKKDRIGKSCEKVKGGKKARKKGKKK